VIAPSISRPAHPLFASAAASDEDGAIVLAIRDLHLAFPGARGPVEVLHGVSLHVRRGEKVALVGESGSGKSTIARLVLGLLQDQGSATVAGSVRLKSREIVGDESYIRGVRGDRVSMIFQDPVSALNPAFTIGDQFREVLRRGDPAISKSEATRRARAALTDVHLHEPDRVLASYVFQLSGGMSQRVMIALALVNGPDLLVADEPGSSLDVTVQARTLHLMNDLIGRLATAVLFISHNLGVVREFAGRVYVIYRGRIVEHATAAQLFADARHPYTRALLAAIPKIDQAWVPEAHETSPSFADPLIEHEGCSEPPAASG
jgi:ABC-type dipeptide/oligopeptide/nickel transport system ATPase component